MLGVVIRMHEVEARDQGCFSCVKHLSSDSKPPQKKFCFVNQTWRHVALFEHVLGDSKWTVCTEGDLADICWALVTATVAVASAALVLCRG